MKGTLLIIDDDPGFRQDLMTVLGPQYECIVAEDGDSAQRILKEQVPDVVLLDLLFNGEALGLSYLQQILETDNSLPVIMITEHASVDTAVEAMRKGAFNYISKTISSNELLIQVDKAISQKKLRQQTQILQEEINRDYYRILGDSAAISALRAKIALYANSDQTLLITGESGTGKELVARRIHQQSDRADGPFVALNCAAIPKDLLENELFGHEAGAFTGARNRKQGKLEIAESGSLFFDEIGELQPDAQSKLLRVLEEREYERIGGVRTLKTDARIIAATNHDLHHAMTLGVFRSDLFYRLEMLSIHVPPLRDRREDIPRLIRHFLLKAAHEMKTPAKYMSNEALQLCCDYDWPGNVRELRNAVLSAALGASQNEIEVADLNPRISQGRTNERRSTPAAPESWAELNTQRELAADQASRDVETRFLQQLLERFEGNISRAAQHIGIHRSNLHRMMKRCGLSE